MLTVEVIEDDSAMRALLAEWLAVEGYCVRARAQVGGGVNSNVDAVVVNLLNLPVDGVETVRQVKNLYAGAALIGISTQLSRTVAGESDQARSLGVERLVSKPCSRCELVAAVADAIARSH